MRENAGSLRLVKLRAEALKQYEIESRTAVCLERHAPVVWEGGMKILLPDPHKLSPLISRIYFAAKGGNVCFVAGTLIATAVGHIAIEAIEAGDWVWATNSETGETELKQVVQSNLQIPPRLQESF